MSKKLIIDWNEYNRSIDELAVQISDSGFKPSFIICIARGGLRVGDILSRIFKVKCGYLGVESYSSAGEGKVSDVQNELTFARDLSTTINLNDPLPFQSMRRRLAQKGAKADLKIQKSTPSEIWPTLESVLFERHNVRPVHSMSEMTLLRNLFQENIFCWAAKYKESVLSCVIIYDACSVAHAQYIANSELGRSFGALDFLFQELIEIHYADNLFFDFGISCEKEGTYLNQGLINQKQGFGGRGIVHDFYELTIER